MGKMSALLKGMWVGTGVAAILSGGMIYEGYTITQACTATAKPEHSKIRKQSIDQIFRDHDGYRLYWQDESRRVREEKFGYLESKAHFGTPLIPEAGEFKSLNDKEHFLIFKDLPDGETSYAKILTYQLPGCGYGAYHVEVHLKSNQELSPGLDSWISGKIPQYEPMSEIK